MTEEVPKETKGGEGTDYEGKHIIDRPLRVKSCKKCWSPLFIRSKKMYCKQCERLRNARTTCWIDVRTNIECVTPSELDEMMI